VSEYVKSSRLSLLVIPTGDVRHSSKIREGSQSAEVWSRERKAEWHEEYDGPREQWQVVKERVKNASKQVSEGSAKGATQNAKNIRNKKRAASVLRDGEQTRKRKDAQREDQERIQKTKRRKKAG
jgi:hypothetical protein